MSILAGVAIGLLVLVGVRSIIYLVILAQGFSK